VREDRSKGSSSEGDRQEGEDHETESGTRRVAVARAQPKNNCADEDEADIDDNDDGLSVGARIAKTTRGGVKRGVAMVGSSTAGNDDLDSTAGSPLPKRTSSEIKGK
jgi:hypothetical protein